MIRMLAMGTAVASALWFIIIVVAGLWAGCQVTFERLPGVPERGPVMLEARWICSAE